MNQNNETAFWNWKEPGGKASNDTVSRWDLLTTRSAAARSAAQYIEKC